MSKKLIPASSAALDERPVFFFAEAPGVVAAAITHAPEADAGDIEASATELRIFHRYLGQSCQRTRYWLAVSEPLFLIDEIE